MPALAFPGVQPHTARRLVPPRCRWRGLDKRWLLCTGPDMGLAQPAQGHVVREGPARFQEAPAMSGLSCIPRGSRSHTTSGAIVNGQGLGFQHSQGCATIFFFLGFILFI